MNSTIIRKAPPLPLKHSLPPASLKVNVYGTTVRASVRDDQLDGKTRCFYMRSVRLPDGTWTQELARLGPLAEVRIESTRLFRVDQKTGTVFVEKSRNNLTDPRLWLRLIPSFDKLTGKLTCIMDERASDIRFTILSYVIPEIPEI